MAAKPDCGEDYCPTEWLSGKDCPDAPPSDDGNPERFAAISEVADDGRCLLDLSRHGCDTKDIVAVASAR